MKEKERLNLEQELLLTKSKAQMINLYLNELEEIERLNSIIINQQKRIDKTTETIDEILVYNDFNDTTSAFGNAPEQLKFCLSEYDNIEDFRKQR